MISNCHLIVHYLVVLVIVASDYKLNESVKLSSMFLIHTSYTRNLLKIRKMPKYQHVCSFLCLIKGIHVVIVVN